MHAVIQACLSATLTIHTSQLLPAGLQAVMTDAPAMATRLSAAVRALAALG